MAVSQAREKILSSFVSFFLYVATAFISSSKILKTIQEHGTLVKTKSKSQDSVLSWDSTSLWVIFSLIKNKKWYFIYQIYSKLSWSMSRAAVDTAEQIPSLYQCELYHTITHFGSGNFRAAFRWHCTLWSGLYSL